MFTTEPDRRFNSGQASRVKRTCREELEREAVLPIVIGQVQEIAALRCARIVHHNVDPVKPREGEFHQRPLRPRFAKIQRDRGGRPSALLDAAHGIVEGRAVAGANHHPGALPRKPVGDGPSDPAVPPGYDSNLSVQHPFKLP